MNNRFIGDNSDSKDLECAPPSYLAETIIRPNCFYFKAKNKIN